MLSFICKIIGHKPVTGQLQRSPNTVYTHWQDKSCSRCGLHLSRTQAYRDARVEPELFRNG